MKSLFYVVQWTWGILQNLIGGIICLFFICLGNKPEMFRNDVLVRTKYNWSGCFSIGMFIFISKNGSSTIPHEYGHSIQSFLFGPAWLFIVGIPSAVRFLYRDIMIAKGKGSSLPPYDSIWFEKTATEWGKRAVNNEWKLF